MSTFLPTMEGSTEYIDFLGANVKTEELINYVDYDAIVIVGCSLCPKSLGSASALANAIAAVKRIDSDFEKQVTVVSINETRVVYSPTGPLNRDQDDVRAFYEAALKGVKRALLAGAKKPLVSIPVGPFSHYNDFNVESTVVLGALEAIYVPLEIRENVPDRKRKVDQIGFLNFHGGTTRFSYLIGIEKGRTVYRDIGGSDPERMAPPRVEEYITQLFANTPVTVKVIANREQLEANYPCLAAVDRCASHVKRHNARMILLEYNEGTAEEVVALIGKGVTFDTGGADIKAGGVMVGMHRDKCGAAAVAGFFKILAVTKPKNLRVLGAMCMVRNSVGSDSYVADELITSRAGVRVRIGNTDAEGRMAMVDALAEMKERILEAGVSAKAHLYTIATLTSHACIAVGEPYSVTLDNGPAKAKNSSQALQTAGEQIADMFEISTLRREDFLMVEGKSEYEDVLQCNNKSSASTPRGHQFPAAFLIRVAGLDAHGCDSANPIAYSHLDIAASSGPFPGIPSGSPVPALAQKYIYPRL
ncbi:putative aminopeptidase W07G4.4 isoform X3 [Varroa jacobsoni]|uniref:Cytosol aminopeptidase domain-containing protein n=1 Tax=Varroa destructor TaxID=109461 RepID=A0A7M7M797_VARDE|nr:putative aminopeptidase W07G4.4 isoform X3 [Varroa destructor]XP_022691040.1 putative aminopeptidase W07G4.4 isoform X3 [Varroa jacobsoni]